MGSKITMDDIADKLNISKSLVSRALSDSYGVSDDMRNKIKMTALNMGYKFKVKRRARFSQIESVTIIVERHDLLDSGFWVKIINGIEKELNRKGISVFLSVIESDDEDTLPLSIKQMKTDGVIILGQIPMKHIISTTTSGLPVVLVDSQYAHLKFDHVLANNYTGAYEATKHLIDSGHRKIGFVGATSYSYSFRERLRGFMDCIKDQEADGFATYQITDQFDDFYTPFSKKQFKMVMDVKDRPTALLCANDIVAFYVYDLLFDSGFTIPQDVSVMGFDNVPKSEWVTPALSTVHIPKTSLGERAVDLLMKKIEDLDKVPEMVLVGTYTIKRESVLNINKKS
jgi:DNA-binding LacI/PurR family transcriptional regulator